MENIHMEMERCIKRIPDFKNLVTYLKRQLTYSMGRVFDWAGRTLKGIYERNFCFLLCTETLLRFRSLVLENNELLKMVLSFESYYFPHLHDYMENFKKQVDRKSHQMNYIEHVFTKSKLGPDIAKRIVSHL